MEATTIPELVEGAAARYGGLEAVVDGNTRWSFNEYRDQALRIAASLMERGIRPGDRVAVWAPNSSRWAATALGVHCAGAVLVPVNTRLPGDDAAEVLARTAARLLFTVTDFPGADYLGMLGEAGATLPETVVMSGGAPDGTTAWDPFTDREGPAAGDLPVVDPADICHILFTSGTTGRPRGAMLRHGSVCRSYRSWSAAIGLAEGDRYLAVNPFFHTFGLNGGVLACLMTGATLVPMASFDPAAVLTTIEAERITVLPGPPTVFRSLLDHPGRGGADVSSLRLAVTGAAPVPSELLVEMAYRLGFESVLTGYGLTEASGVTTTCAAGDPQELVASSAGRPLPGVEVAVVDPDGARVPVGGLGQVLIRGYNVMAGYLDDPDATAAAVDPEGWLHTGDVGSLDGDGNLRVTDRLDDTYMSGGFNVYPAEVEATLRRHPDIAEVAVVGVPDERMGRVGMAFVVPVEPGRLDPGEVIRWSRDRTAAYAVPRHVEEVPALPTNPAGKVARRQLAETAAALLADRTTPG